MVKQFLSATIERGNAYLAQRDSVTGSDGLQYCPVCGEPLQLRQSLLGHEMILPKICSCGEREFAEQTDRDKRADFILQLEDLRRHGISDGKYRSCTFEADDRQNAKISDTCRRYAAEFAAMLSQNIGILFYGNIGTGKTFYAACIVNELLSHLVPAGITAMPTLLNAVQAADIGRKQEAIDRLRDFKLLVIDDLGAERSTSYGLEQIYNIVDTRARTGLPTIFTTNLDLAEITDTACDRAQRRIYDRVLEMCPVRIALKGGSRRSANAAQRLEAARKLMDGNQNHDADPQICPN